MVGSASGRTVAVLPLRIGVALLITRLHTHNIILEPPKGGPTFHKIRDPGSRVVLGSDWRIPHIAFVICAHRVGSTIACILELTHGERFFAYVYACGRIYRQCGLSRREKSW